MPRAPNRDVSAAIEPFDTSESDAKTKSAVTDSISEDAEEEIDESKLKTDSDGFYYYYVADIDDARKVGLAVSKKAETVDANDTDALEDLGWKKTGSVWSAYEVNDKEMQTGYESLGSFYNSVEEFEAAYNNDNKKEYAKYIYINIKIILYPILYIIINMSKAS